MQVHCVIGYCLYYTEKEYERGEIYAGKCMKYLTFYVPNTLN